MTALEVLEPLRDSLVPIAALQPGICPVCRTATKVGFDDCYRCNGQQFRVLPITMSISQGLIHHHLRYYKDHPVADTRTELTYRLAALLETFLRNHLNCLGGTVQRVATVPSSKTQRDAPWEIIKFLGRFSGHTNPITQHSDLTLGVDGDVEGQRILLLDDTFTSGQSIFNAAQLLTRQGAIVVPVVLGRHINADYPPSQPLLAALRPKKWDPTQCGICGGIQCPTITPDAGTLL